VDVLSSHLALIFMPPLDPVWVGLRLIPLVVVTPSNELVGWLTESGLVVCCGRLSRIVHGWVSHMFGLSSGSFDLWICTSSIELEYHSNGHVLSIGQVMVWTSHIGYDAW
jgi:hypothetical protein